MDYVLHYIENGRTAEQCQRQVGGCVQTRTHYSSPYSDTDSHKMVQAETSILEVENDRIAEQWQRQVVGCVQTRTHYSSPYSDTDSSPLPQLVGRRQELRSQSQWQEGGGLCANKDPL